MPGTFEQRAPVRRGETRRAESRVSAGVRAILNYAPMVIQVPENVWVRHIDPVAVLHSMTYYLAREEDKES